MMTLLAIARPALVLTFARLSILLFLPAIAAQAAKSAYTCTVFTYGDPDWVIHPTGINNLGQVVGYATGSDGISHGFLRNQDGSVTPIDAPGAAGFGSTQPQAINNAGQIAGMYYVGSDAHGFIRGADGSYVDVAPPAPPTEAGDGATVLDFVVSGLNDNGVIAGTYHVRPTSNIDPNTYFYTRDPSGTYRVVDRVRSMFGYFNTQSAVLNNSGTVLERAGDTDAVLQPPGGPVLFPGLPRYQPRPTYNWTSGFNNLATAGTLLNIHSGFIRSASAKITPVFCPRDVSADLTISAINDGAVVAGTLTRESQVKGFIGIPTLTAPRVTLSDTSYDFGTVAMNGQSRPFRVYLKNEGPNIMHVQAMYGFIENLGRPSPFTVTDSDCAPPTGKADMPFAKGSVQPDATCYVDIVYQPIDPGAASGNLYILDDAPDSPQTISLKGTSVLSPIRLSNSSWDFGAQPLGHTTGDGIIYIYNEGPVDVSFDSISISSNPNEFAVSGTTCSPELRAYTTCNIRFNFTPAAAGERYGTLRLNGTGQQQKTTDIPLQGWAQ